MEYFAVDSRKPCLLLFSHCYPTLMELEYVLKCVPQKCLTGWLEHCERLLHILVVASP